jgi:hypothetical protein
VQPAQLHYISHPLSRMSLSPAVNLPLSACPTPFYLSPSLPHVPVSCCDPASLCAPCVEHACGQTMLQCGVHSHVMLSFLLWAWTALLWGGRPGMWFCMDGWLLGRACPCVLGSARIPGVCDADMSISKTSSLLMTNHYKLSLCI